MSTTPASLPDGKSIVVSDSRISVDHAQVFAAAGIVDDPQRDIVATHVTFEGTDDKLNPVDVTVRLNPRLAAELAAALAAIENYRSK